MWIIIRWVKLIILRTDTTLSSSLSGNRLFRTRRRINVEAPQVSSPLKNYEYRRSSRKREPARRDDRAYPEVDL